MLTARSISAAGFCLAPAHQRTATKFRISTGGSKRARHTTLAVTSKLVLVPTGDGSTKHLEEPVSLPEEIELKDGVFEVGREEPADVVIPIPTVSGRHALLRITGTKVQVTDLGSTNGTYLDEEELPTNRAAEVYVGSRITFGDASLAMFELVERPEDVTDVAADTEQENVVSV
ncbi:SMAD/FHA domain-containing protein [Coccomyxa subellipsoidea C-169]|uniref:SMAD/FHA domain-containing protein n=1 Tax=Coccomyxa subellipsoidea (strain C-169) TaxID=574566 RepID=I0YP46_COCSC|nr:SMAD/FHA domain-containing protein [Coccomyxa subellipsoidea C-169]EIE20165.1 SMAD/FHA domain-containing protein [Coccomyxa subellipsoidea C-169]|eukprot:XP_005644709.1 SMAD/FHA domain-containing protein [Coccomyxa subellipsoidea C-169]